MFSSDYKRKYTYIEIQTQCLQGVGGGSRGFARPRGHPVTHNFLNTSASEIHHMIQIIALWENKNQ